MYILAAIDPGSASSRNEKRSAQILRIFPLTSATISFRSWLLLWGRICLFPAPLGSQKNVSRRIYTYSGDSKIRPSSCFWINRSRFEMILRVVRASRSSFKLKIRLDRLLSDQNVRILHRSKLQLFLLQRLQNSRNRLTAKAAEFTHKSLKCLVISMPAVLDNPAKSNDVSNSSTYA